MTHHTDRRETADEETLLTTVLNRSRDGIVVLRAVYEGERVADLEWSRINPAAEAMLDCRAEARLGRCLSETPGSLQADLLGRYLEVMESGTPLELEHQDQATGRMLRVVATKVGNELLVTFTCQGEQAGEPGSDFVSSMSYALRTPLTTVIGFSEILQEGHFGSLNDRQCQTLGDINEAGRRLLSVINDALDLSKIASGRVELNLESLDVPTLVRGALAIVNDRAARKNLRVEAELPDAIDLLLADERKLKQALYNLLSNAVNFTPEGGGVWVRVEDGEHEVRFEVEDSGIGIAPEDLPKLFRPFAQVDSSVSRRFEGSGLGLSLVKLLAELHGGSVWVRSEPGLGSTFGFSVPRRT